MAKKIPSLIENAADGSLKKLDFRIPETLLNRLDTVREKVEAQGKKLQLDKFLAACLDAELVRLEIELGIRDKPAPRGKKKAAAGA